MLRKPNAKTKKTAVCVLLPLILVNAWFWNLQRDWAFINAVRTNNISKVRAGLDSGIDPNKATMLGVTALRFATNYKPGNREIIRLLLDHGANPNDGIYHAAACQPPEIIHLLLDRGANPTNGLCSAVDAKRTDMVQLLIARGANVNTKCFDTNRSVLLDAAEYGNNQIVHLLKAAGAKK